MGLTVEGCVTRVGLLQLVPTEEGSFLLLAEVRSLLQEPVGDPTLADPWRKRNGARSGSSLSRMLADMPDSSFWGGRFSGPGLKRQMKLILTCYLSNHSLRDPPVRQEGLNLLFDHSTVPPVSTEKYLLFSKKYNKSSQV